MLINFLTDGYLPPTTLEGSEYSPMRLEQYKRQLLVAYYGLFLMKNQNHNLTIQSETKDAVKELIKNYKADGGGNEFDDLNNF